MTALLDGHLQKIFCPYSYVTVQTAPQIDDLARHREDSPGYTNAIINLLLYLREKGIDINEIGVQGVSSSPMMLRQMYKL